MRRSSLGLTASIVAVVLTTTAATAFVSGTATPSGPSETTQAEATPSPDTTPTTAPATPAADPAATGAAATATPVDAALADASDELVRAEYLAGEASAAVTPAQLDQINTTRVQLRELVDAAEDAVPVDAVGSLAAGNTTAGGTAAGGPTSGIPSTGAPMSGPGTPDLEAAGRLERASRSASDGRAPLDADADAKASDATPSTTPDADATADPAEATGDTAAGDAATKDAAADAKTGAADVPLVAADPTPEEIAAVTASLRTLLDASLTGIAVDVVPGPPPPPTAEELAAQLAAKMAFWAKSTAGYSNGTIPSSVLCRPTFAPTAELRCDASHQLEQLNTAFAKAFGTNLGVTDSYRSYGSQISVKASKGYLAAVPGTSNHGLALAVDLGSGVNSSGTAQYQWMVENAGTYGWHHPAWAQPGGSKPEAWHWEYGTGD